MAPKRPTWFRKRDIVIPYSLPILSGGLTGYLFTRKDLTDGSGLPLPTGLMGVHGFMVLLTLVFVAIAYIWVYRWIEKLREFEYVKGGYYAFMVHRGAYTAAYDNAQLIEEFEAAFTGWSRVYGSVAVERFAQEGLFWVWFEPHPIKDRIRGKQVKLAGLTIAGSRSVRCSYKNPEDDPSKTSLQHELGHVIQGAITGQWNEAVHHNTAQKYNLK